ncbi:MAG: hypothetical protein SFV55_25570, partial [Haliscomenobacter sp.]
MLIIDSLPPQGILLDKGWKWHAGDNPDYAKADFDDSSWESIDPSQDVMDLKQISKEGKIAWLRLHFTIPKTDEKQLLMIVKHIVASEIYLNGKLVKKLGEVSPEYEKEEKYSPIREPVVIELDTMETQVLAIRYSNTTGWKLNQYVGR